MTETETETESESEMDRYRVTDIEVVLKYSSGFDAIHYSSIPLRIMQRIPDPTCMQLILAHICAKTAPICTCANFLEDLRSGVFRQTHSALHIPIYYMHYVLHIILRHELIE